jgi:hypothetical protein
MKPTIAAGLVSWLLMAPPIDTGWSARFNPATPLSRWLVVNSYDSAGECDFAREGRIFTAMRALDRSPDEIRRQRRHRLLIWAYLWECDTSDDPRLHRGD